MEALYNISAGKLKQTIFLEALENRAFDLDKLIGQKQCKESIGIGVDGHIEGDDLVIQGHGMEYAVYQSKDKHAQWQENLGPARRITG